MGLSGPSCQSTDLPSISALSSHLFVDILVKYTQNIYGCTHTQLTVFFSILNNLTFRYINGKMYGHSQNPSGLPSVRIVDFNSLTADTSLHEQPIRLPQAYPYPYRFQRRHDLGIIH